MSNEIPILISPDGLSALADVSLASENQLALDELLTLNAAGTITPRQQQQLETLLIKVDELNLVKARAAVALQQLNAGEIR